MPVFRMHCSSCSTDFIDSRPELRDGDEAVCPKCGAHHELTPELIRAVRRDLAELNPASAAIHVEPEAN